MAKTLLEWLRHPNDLFPRLLLAAAPEKKEDLAVVLKEIGGITFLVDEKENCILFSSDRETRTIRVGLRCLGRLWANAYAYFVMFTEIGQVLREDSTTREFDLDSTPRFQKAKAILEWSTNNDIEIKLSGRHSIEVELDNYPPELPEPFSDSKKGSDEDAADEISLMALGFILHHELAHLRLQHTGYCTQIEVAFKDGDSKRATELSSVSVTQELIFAHNFFQT